MMEHRSYLILMVEDGVDVCDDNDGPQSGRRCIVQVLPVNNMRRPLNLVEISVRTAYIGMPSLTSPSIFACCHKQSLRCAFSIALMLRALCDNLEMEFKSEGFTSFHANVSA